MQQQTEKINAFFQRDSPRRDIGGYTIPRSLQPSHMRESGENNIKSKEDFRSQDTLHAKRRI